MNKLVSTVKGSQALKRRKDLSLSSVCDGERECGREESSLEGGSLPHGLFIKNLYLAKNCCNQEGLIWL